MRRPGGVVVAAAAVAVLGGCGSDDSAPSFDVEDAVRKADKAPYSAQVEIQTFIGQPWSTMTGRVNYNAPKAGTLRIRHLVGKSPVDYQEVVTSDADYMLYQPGSKGSGGRWRKVPPGVSDFGSQDVDSYTHTLLGMGPSVRKGVEQQGGEPAYRLSGTLTLERVRPADQFLHLQMSVTKKKWIDCDVWINKAGRVVRAEQRTPDGLRRVTVLKDFGAPVKVSVPKDVDETG
ncbi:hypothetical protein [Streptomyces sp. I05A-00742]|uniref:hypothetical protein n=1 Tax=Streptomyces sp. I05A-00742 TaxID=2732853 RepID=UPI001487EC2C|nr:hypothetical protein [Streptomyces sp. I05A-00742]